MMIVAGLSADHWVTYQPHMREGIAQFCQDIQAKLPEADPNELLQTVRPMFLHLASVIRPPGQTGRTAMEMFDLAVQALHVMTDALGIDPRRLIPYCVAYSPENRLVGMTVLDSDRDLSQPQIIQLPNRLRVKLPP